MTDNHTPYVAVWNKHIHVLAGDIGPRGSTTEQERRAAEYSRQVMAGLGYSPHVETFTSARSIFMPHLILALGMLTAFIIYPLAGRASAAIAAVIALAFIGSESLELLFRDNLLRRLIAKGTSQNVFATTAPRGEHRQDLVLIGHLDSNRSPLIFRTIPWFDFWRIIAPIMFFVFWAQTALYILGAVTLLPWIWPASIPGAVCAVLLAVLMIEAQLSPYSPGANDNATGAGLVLALGEHLKAQPLAHTRVWLVNTGCEEVKHYGAIDFFARHRREMVSPKSLVFEMLGRDGPAWLEREVIIPPFEYRADPAMVALVRQLAAEHPEWRAHPTTVAGGHTEMADPLRVGIPAITFIGIGANGTPIGYKGPALYWHHTEDTPDKLVPEVMERAYALTWAFITALDKQAS